MRCCRTPTWINMCRNHRHRCRVHVRTRRCRPIFLFRRRRFYSAMCRKIFSIYRSQRTEPTSQFNFRRSTPTVFAIVHFIGRVNTRHVPPCPCKSARMSTSGKCDTHKSVFNSNMTIRNRQTAVQCDITSLSSHVNCQRVVSIPSKRR
jgi:hypothetical protein